MKILLIEPPFERFQGVKRSFFTLGIAYLAGYLAGQGHEVKIYDAEHSRQSEYTPYAEAAKGYIKYIEGLNNKDHPIWQEVDAQIRDFAPELIGISCPTVKYEPALKIAAIAKEISPEINVALGGCHPTVMAVEVLGDDNVDFVIRCEG